jgi:hypothetical protein
MIRNLKIRVHSKIKTNGMTIYNKPKINFNKIKNALFNNQKLKGLKQYLTKSPIKSKSNHNQNIRPSLFRIRENLQMK